MASDTRLGGRVRPSEYDPDTFPEEYASICVGDCLEPVFHHGECLAFSKSAGFGPGDFVSVFLERWRDGQVVRYRGVKRLGECAFWPMSFPLRLAPGSEVAPLITLEMLNPLSCMMVPATEVVAMHKLIGVARSDGSGKALLDRRSLEKRLRSAGLAA